MVVRASRKKPVHQKIMLLEETALPEDPLIFSFSKSLYKSPSLCIQMIFRTLNPSRTVHVCVCVCLNIIVIIIYHVCYFTLTLHSMQA